MDWATIVREASESWRGPGRYPVRAYSEYMPAQLVGWKPCARGTGRAVATLGALEIDEYEWAHELAPGLDRIARHVTEALGKLVRGEPHALSRTLLDGNPAWPPELAAAAAAGALADEPLVLALALALSRTHDDKGNDRFTLFGTSHDGAGAALDGLDDAALDALVRWAGGTRWARHDEPLAGIDTVVTTQPFAALPDRVRAAYLARAVRLVPSPASLVFAYHPRYHALAEELPRATQIPLLHLFPRVEDRYAIRIPQSGWLDEGGEAGHRVVAHIARTHRWQRTARDVGLPEDAFHDKVSTALFSTEPDVLGLYDKPLARNVQIWTEDYRLVLDGPVADRAALERAAREVGAGGRFGYRMYYPPMRAGARELFWHVPLIAKLAPRAASAQPAGSGMRASPAREGEARRAPAARLEHAGLLARHRYTVVRVEPARRDGPASLAAAGTPQQHDAAGLAPTGALPQHEAASRTHAEQLARHEYTAMAARPAHARGAQREPTAARYAAHDAQIERWAGAPLGYITVERAGAETTRHAPVRLARPAHVAAAALPPQHGRPTPSHNARTLLDAHELLGASLSPSFARSLLRLAKAETLDDYLATALAELRSCIGVPEDPGPPLVLERLGDRAFEEAIWRSISALADGEFRQKANSDGIAVNRGKTGGPAAAAAHLRVEERRDLEKLGDHLHDRYRALIAGHGMTGAAEVVDHVFRWDTDFALPWMEGWAKNRDAPGERNIVVMIPGRNRGEAVIMADHYDTAYMEDVYDADRGGDTLRAPALGADDNHSATTALMLAADQLLPLAAAGRLERDVWLVHLTGEEFPADSLGARAICQGLVERSLVFTAEDGAARDVSHVEVVGAFVLDMIGHNTHRALDVFQIAPGEGAAALRLAWRAQRANQRWNRAVTAWNAARDRHGKGRAARMPDGTHPPPPFAHLAVHGEVRVEWEPRSALYNTDGQVFSDLGVPVVLIMENYDISRTGYHDTLDTMANIDLDYCAALTAIAIEAVADTACAEDP